MQGGNIPDQKNLSAEHLSAEYAPPDARLLGASFRSRVVAAGPNRMYDERNGYNPSDNWRTQELPELRGLTSMQHVMLACCCAGASLFLLPGNVLFAQANEDESKVPEYSLPDPLLAANGQAITDAKTWKESRRGEVLDLFREQMYGRSPARPKDMSFQQFESDKNALGGLAVRKQVTIFLSSDKKGPSIDLLLYIPKAATKPVPAFVGLNFQGNHTVHSDPAIRLSQRWMRNKPKSGITNHRASEESRGAAAIRWPIELILQRGYAVATAYYGDIDPDFDDGFQKRCAADVLQGRPNSTGR